MSGVVLLSVADREALKRFTEAVLDHGPAEQDFSCLVGELSPAGNRSLMLAAPNDVARTAIGTLSKTRALKVRAVLNVNRAARDAVLDAIREVQAKARKSLGVSA